MKASIEDVARQAGVSTATVSRAFSRPDMVSAKTRAKVMEAAQQLDFSVSLMAGILKSGRSHRVALLVGSSKLDWFTSRIIEGLNEVLRSAGYDLVIQPIGDAGAREEFFDELPVRGNADAVIVSSFAITPAEIRRLNTTRIPLIRINTAFYLNDHIDRQELLALTKDLRECHYIGRTRIIFDAQYRHDLITSCHAVRLIFNQTAKGNGLSVVLLWIFYEST